MSIFMDDFVGDGWWSLAIVKVETQGGGLVKVLEEFCLVAKLMAVSFIVIVGWASAWI